MSGHKHAALMAEYAKDAAETDKPWERWEWRDHSYKSGDWQPMVSGSDAAWFSGFEYRSKPDRLEKWANVYQGATIYYDDEATAMQQDCSTSYGAMIRRAVHMREVTE
jgi:hypothetical protein